MMGPACVRCPSQSLWPGSGVLQEGGGPSFDSQKQEHCGGAATGVQGLPSGFRREQSGYSGRIGVSVPSPRPHTCGDETREDDVPPWAAGGPSPPGPAPARALGFLPRGLVRAAWMPEPWAVSFLCAPLPWWPGQRLR